MGPPVQTNNNIKLVELTKDNWQQCIKLWAEDDKGLVSPNVYSIAEAQFYPRAISRAIMANEQMIGYALFGQDDDDDDAWAIDRFMIGKQYRRPGYGIAAIHAIVDQGRNAGFKKFITSNVPSNTPMQTMLTQAGFSTKGELHDGEVVYFLHDTVPAASDDA